MYRIPGFSSFWSQDMKFDLQADVKLYKTKDDGIDHVQFLIKEEGSDVTKGQELDVFENILSSEPKISPETFCQTFPFHLMFSRDMTITQAGTSISRVIPCLQLEEVGKHFSCTLDNFLNFCITSKDLCLRGRNESKCCKLILLRFNLKIFEKY